MKLEPSPNRILSSPDEAASYFQYESTSGRKRTSKWAPYGRPVACVDALPKRAIPWRAAAQAAEVRVHRVFPDRDTLGHAERMRDPLVREMTSEHQEVNFIVIAV